MLLIGIAGSICSGKKTLAQLLQSTGDFHLIDLSSEARTDPSAASDRLQESLSKFPSSNLVFFPIQHTSDLAYLQKDSRFVMISLDSPVRLRYQRFVKLHGKSGDALKNFLQQDDDLQFSTHLSQIVLSADRILQNSGTVEDLSVQLKSLNILSLSYQRPSFDLYFMRFAEIVSTRSGCLRHAGGCVLTAENKVVSTGYSGIPKAPVQCIDGGCQSCLNRADDQCFCNHAEMNAIVEAKSHKKAGCSIYSKIFPCFACALAIVQVKAKHLFYSRRETWDAKTSDFLETHVISVVFLSVVG
jgi:dCMP deaminase